MSRASDIIGCVGNLLFFGSFALYAYGVPATTIGGVIVGGILVFWGVGEIRTWVHQQQKCAHGVRAGATGRCPTCAAEDAQRRAQIQKERDTAIQERERRKRISDEAQKLRKSEIERLSNAWVRLAESYFAMTPQQFEDAIAELFRRLGYKVKQTPLTNDGGKDAIAWKDDKKVLIECKRYGATASVGRRDVQIFVAAIQDEKADSGFYINTGIFTRTAITYAKKNGITLYDRSRLPLLVNDAYPGSADLSNVSVMCTDCGSVISVPLEDSPTTSRCPQGHVVSGIITKGDLKVLQSGETQIPKCADCGSQMRIVRRGLRGFWGCTRYPKCRWTKPLAR